MPVMDGLTFLHHFKQIPRLREIPILLMTAQESPPASDGAAVLLKPFAPTSLLSLVKRFLT
jgi:CheY-like chemotaxis protein